jgi:hypothetical protein
MKIKILRTRRRRKTLKDLLMKPKADRMKREELRTLKLDIHVKMIEVVKSQVVCWRDLTGLLHFNQEWMIREDMNGKIKDYKTLDLFLPMSEEPTWIPSIEEEE